MNGQRRGAARLVAAVAVALLGALGAVGIGATITRPAAAAAFNPNLLMSPAMFGATGTMDAAAIQRFLNRFPNSCLRDYRAPLPLDYSSVGSMASAAEIISVSSTMYGVNPQVVLVTLQKEQSLVTGSGGCDGWRYTSAMGYNCPDGGARYDYPSKGVYGTCVAQERHAGFTAQVNHGTWQLQFNRQRAIGNLYWRGNQNIPNYGYYTKGTYRAYEGAPAIKYDGNGSVGGQSIYMSNGVTATLYTYTPHVSANERFVELFTDWFGSTTGTPSSVTTTTTTLVPLDPADVEPYVDSVYRVLLGRPAEESEEDWWYGYINTRRSWSSFVGRVTGSDEYRRDQVAIDYAAILHRAPDSSGTTTWSAELAWSGRNDLVLAQLAGSTEYYTNRAGSDDATYITQLYLDILGRNVDQGGLNHWLEQLSAQSTSRTNIAYAILQSREYAERVVGQTYWSILGRSADSSGKAYWASWYQRSHRVPDVQNGLAASTEGVAYLSTLQ